MGSARANSVGTGQDQRVLRWPLGGGAVASTWRGDFALVGVLSLLTLLAALLPLSAGERFLFVAFVVGGVARFVQHVRARRLRNAPRGWVSCDASGLTRSDGNGSTSIAVWARPFGVTVLANHSRTRALLAFTTQDATRYLNVAVRGPDDAGAAEPLLRRAATVPDGDAFAGERDDGATLRATDAAALVQAVLSRSSAALQRIYLSGPSGEAIVLDGVELRVGASVFDLASPLEWRAFIFHESVGHVATIYQATWVRQGGAELVLVAPMPADTSAVVGENRDPRAYRDLRLMQSAPDVPPPRELRRAVERLFMLPLRQALDRAPKAARPSLPPERSAEGRA